MTYPRGYTAHDCQRRVVESDKTALPPGMSEPARSDFSRDRARVLHCAALRRLADKTQVVQPRTQETCRTRLTHSLEVAQIGRDIAVALGANPDLVELAGLAHDLGHPPYGHNGETVLNQLASPWGGFEGNAQTFRILTFLEPKVLDAHHHSVGLNLTRASLDAITKYPWTHQDHPQRTKYSFYCFDHEYASWMRQGAPPEQVCVEAQIMNWADDIAYSVHDLEDGIITGAIDLAVLADRDLIDELARTHQPDMSAEMLCEAATRLHRLAVIASLGHYDDSLDSLVKLKSLTSELVGRFTTALVRQTHTQVGKTTVSRYHASIRVPQYIHAEISLLKLLALHFVMLTDHRRRHHDHQRAILSSLFTHLVDSAPDGLDPLFAHIFLHADTDAQRYRAIIDHLACLTETRLDSLKP